MNGDTYSSRADGGRHGSSRGDYQSSRRDRGDRDDRRDRPDRPDRPDRSDRPERSDRGDRGGDRGGGRRRSRSPDYRNRPRRDDATDIDAYSSSRSHRDREREDRYSGRDSRRGPDREREWDRDRGAGRSRREEDDGGNRRRGGDRDRDPALMDDRRPPRGGGAGRDGGRDGGRGGGRGGDRGPDRGGNDEREFAERERRRSASPPPKKREPTPDLTDVVPVLERRRRLTQWDIKPPGYDNVTAEQAKLSGMFPLPGAPRQQAMDPTKLQAFMSQPGGAINSAALKPTNSRQSKRLIITNLPPAATEESMVQFFNLQLNGLNVIESTDPCAACQISPDHSFAMLELRTSTDATVALALDGVTMEVEDAHNGNGNGAAPQGLQIRRPKDYIVPAVVEDPNYDPDSDVPSSVVIDSPNKISVTNLPPYLSEDQVMELLVSFGKLKSFVLAKDSSTEESRGIAFLEYVDPSVTAVAIQGLHGMMLGDHSLKVQKASIGITQVSGEMGVNAMSMLAGTTSMDTDVGRVLQLLNMVTPEELMDNEDYEEIRDDVQAECEKYGKILSLKIPRPVGGSRQSAGIGKIFIKFETPESATKALRALAGRKFSDRTVVTTYFPEENFDVGAW
ncbi:hypothetical protein B0H67DRAFT_51806 [Lasiosphaeris hirsuta]|uniref:RRM domain-containing protein n=1 Tax=Lasiosphaeris hirsuta TaxID=260670 RepID=A0AA40BAV2_9PEZI|nr:hypothetical protein B0H67DRAFT_51806 [Lasiosphaeris hirsuta]